MKKLSTILTLCLGLGFATGTQAAGCLSGAVAGGLVGHVAGHHGLMGAAVGCAVGHHEAAVKQKQTSARDQKNPSDDNVH